MKEMHRQKCFKGTSILLILLMTCLVVLVSGCAGKADSTTANRQKDVILIGRVNPNTGPIAAFGAGTPWVEEQALAAINQAGGIYIAEYGRKLPVRMIVADSESNPTKAAEAANKLILQDKVDILLVEHTPATVNPVSAAAERHKIPCISLDDPADAWLAGGPYQWSFHAFWQTSSLADVYVDMWDQVATNKKVGFLASNDPDGITFAKYISERAAARGYTIVDPGRFPADTKDFTSLINEFKQQGCDIIAGNMITPDFSTAWRQAHQQGHIPKVLSMGRAILFPSDVAALGGDMGIGLTTELWWSPEFPYKSSLTGQTSAELAHMWLEGQKSQPTAVIGYKHAGIEIVVDALQRAQSLDREKVRQAIKATNLDTVVGHIQYDDRNFAETKVAGGQWVKGQTWPWEIKVVSNKQAPAIPLAGDSMLVISGAR